MVFILSCLPLLVIASDSKLDIKHSVNNGASLIASAVEPERLKIDALKSDSLALGLKPEDLKRYYDILNSPQGFYYKRGEANPYFVLAAEAENEKERMRFARLWVKGEEQDSEKVGKAIKAYSAASIERFGLSPKVWNLTDDLIMGGDSEEEMAGRISFYITTSACDKCELDFKKLNNQLLTGLISGIDIFFVDTEKRTSDDSKNIRSWATKLGVDPNKVINKQITLNYGARSMASSVPFQERNEL